MPKFDVWLNTQNKKPRVVKVKADGESSLDNAVFVKTIVSSTKSAALKQATTQVKSGLIKMPTVIKTDIPKIGTPVLESLPTVEEFDVKKAIFVDYNGVLDDPERSSNERSLAFKLPNEACPHKIFRLAKLAVEHEADLVFISEHRLYGGDLRCTILRCLFHCGIEEYSDWARDNEELISDLSFCPDTPQLNTGRSDEVRDVILKEKYTHYVVFEDYHHIDSELNPIMTENHIGLTEEHIEKAGEILSK